MAATEKDMTWTQGSTWRGQIEWTVDGIAKDLTGYAFRMQVRKKYADVDTLGPYIDIDSGTKGGITVAPVQGLVTMIVDGDEITMPKGQYVYDIEFDDPDGLPDKLFRGRITVNPEVTRA